MPDWMIRGHFGVVWKQMTGDRLKLKKIIWFSSDKKFVLG